MSEIAPCITVETPEQYNAMVEKIKPFAKRVQIDISDGQFSPVLMVPPDKLWWPKEWVVDIHAMVNSPMDYLNSLIKLKPNLIIFHVETGVDLVSIMKTIRQYGIKAGVAILKPSVPLDYEEIIKEADHVLVFCGDLGYYGGKASLMQLEKVRLIKAINPKAEIGWDGGVNIENAFTLSQGGVDVLNSGGAIGNAENPSEIYDKLVSEINKQGVI
ncbi:MAG TPA: hypothetical protein PLO25_00190 [Candidatus Saccharibacteria bacterium]|nr:hypothetical protein [Candidatus Saccharibacteria bacterium]